MFWLHEQDLNKRDLLRSPTAPPSSEAQNLPMIEEDSRLIEGRVCGECTVCCSALRIEEPAIKKMPGVPCRHLLPAGRCGIYSDRPSVCRTWYCGWRRIGALGDDWRPDRSRVLLRVEEAPFPRKTILIMEALDRDPSALASESAVEFAMALVSRSVQVSISVQTKAGFCNALVPVDKKLRPAVQMVDAVQGAVRARQILIAGIEHAAQTATAPERP